MLDGLKRMTEEGRPSTGQDMLKGRRTEIDFLNGLVAAKGEEVGMSGSDTRGTHRGGETR